MKKYHKYAVLGGKYSDKDCLPVVVVADDVVVDVDVEDLDVVVVETCATSTLKSC